MGYEYSGLEILKKSGWMEVPLLVTQGMRPFSLFSLLRLPGVDTKLIAGQWVDGDA